MVKGEEEKYEVLLDRVFVKELSQLTKSGDKSILRKVERLIGELRKDPKRPRPHLDVKRLSPMRRKKFRARIGGYRIVYHVDDDERRVYLTSIFHREKEYNRFLGFF